MLSLRKRIISLILLCALCSLAVSCGKQSDEKAQANAVDTIENNVDTSETIDPEEELMRNYSLPDENFDGYEFNIMIRGHADEWDSQDIVAEEDSGEGFVSAVYNRNIELEEKFNVKLVGKWFKVDEQYNRLKKSVQAAEQAYDAVMLNFQDASKAAKDKLLLSLNDIPYVNLEMPWWDQSLMAETSVMNKTYYATGDMTIMDKDGTWTMMFNKQMLASLGLESPYDLVRQHKWTLDKFMELGKGVSQDINGNGKFDKDDQYAFATTGDSTQGLFYSSGLRIVKKDAEDIPYFSLTGENVTTNLTKITDIIRGSNNFTLLASDFGNHLIVQSAFEEDRSLFYAEVMQCVIRLRQMDTDFGVIPLPMADENQDTYHTNIHAWASATIAIPADIENVERSGLIVEALAYLGRKWLKPAYYDLALKSKFTRDDDSSEMLDIIFAGRSADLGYVDNVGSLMNDIKGLVEKNKTTFTSTIEKKEKSITKDLDKMINSYEELMNR